MRRWFTPEKETGSSHKPGVAYKAVKVRSGSAWLKDDDGDELFVLLVGNTAKCAHLNNKANWIECDESGQPITPETPTDE